MLTVSAGPSLGVEHDSGPGCADQDVGPPIRVASVPEAHGYVRHLSGLHETSVTRLPDPRPAGATSPEQWWPPVMLTPEWITEFQHEFDVFHLHFGFDALGPRQLQDIVGALRQAGKPLVHTAHDLRNPHHENRKAHDDALDVLIPAADALITLTRGAASEIHQRWRRTAEVIPHPHIVDLDRIGTGRPVRDDPGAFVVGVHAKSVRLSSRPLDVVQALLPLAAELPGLRLRMNVHHAVYDVEGRQHDPGLRRFADEAVAGGQLELQVHDFFTDEQLWNYLQSLDVSVLPYRFGTHSGWLEACYDLGTTVVAPTCGYFPDQHDCLSYGHDETGLDAASLRDAVRRAYEQRPAWQADAGERAREREAVALAHRRIYQALLA